MSDENRTTFLEEWDWFVPGAILISMGATPIMSDMLGFSGYPQISVGVVIAVISFHILDWLRTRFFE